MLQFVLDLLLIGLQNGAFFKPNANYFRHSSEEFSFEKFEFEFESNIAIWKETIISCRQSLVYSLSTNSIVSD